MQTARVEFPWVSMDATTMINERKHDLKWWTFAGRAANAGLAAAIGRRIPGAATFDNLSVTIENGREIEEFDEALASLSRLPDDDFLSDIDADAVNALKFSDCLPREMATRMLQRRSSDLPAIRAVLAEPPRRIVIAE